MMTILQWASFAGIVTGAYFYVSRPRAGALSTAAGCALLGIWALLLTPAAYGTFAVQAAVFVLSLRNAINVKGSTNA